MADDNDPSPLGESMAEATQGVPHLKATLNQIMIPANQFNLGEEFRLQASGTFSTTDTPTWQWTEHHG